MRARVRRQRTWAAVFLAWLAGETLPTPAGAQELVPDARWDSGVSCVPEREFTPSVSAASWVAIDARGSTIRVVGSGADRTTGSATLDFSSFDVRSRGILSYRGTARLALGGSSAGVEGAAAGEILFGLRVPITPYEGPFMRLGMGGRLFGSGILIEDSTGLPLGEVGYESIGAGVGWGMAARSAYVVWGGFETGGQASRDLDDAPMFGAAAWMMANPALLRLEWQRVYASDGGTALPIDIVQSSGCTAPALGPVKGLSLCLDASLSTGGVLRPGATDLSRSTAIAAGISVGIGGLQFGPVRMIARPTAPMP
jgi:hypothetical protein